MRNYGSPDLDPPERQSDRSHVCGHPAFSHQRDCKMCSLWSLPFGTQLLVLCNNAIFKVKVPTPETNFNVHSEILPRLDKNIGVGCERPERWIDEMYGGHRTRWQECRVYPDVGFPESFSVRILRGDLWKTLHDPTRTRISSSGDSPRIDLTPDHPTAL